MNEIGIDTSRPSMLGFSLSLCGQLTPTLRALETILMASVSRVSRRLMRHTLSIAIVVTLVCANAASAQVPTRNADEQAAFESGCDFNQWNMNVCSMYDYKVLDAQLNSVYKSQLAHLGKSAARARLIASQRAWLKYVELDCHYQTGPREESGSIWPVQHNYCMAAHLRQRIDLLKSYVSCTQNGCPAE